MTKKKGETLYLKQVKLMYLNNKNKERNLHQKWGAKLTHQENTKACKEEKFFPWTGGRQQLLLIQAPGVTNQGDGMLIMLQLHLEV